MIDINLIKETDYHWNQVHTGDTFSIYHTEAWKNLIVETFKHEAMYIGASQNGLLIDVLPFFIIKNKFLGKKMVSTPYEGCNGGFHCKDGMVRRKLIEKIIEHAHDLKVKHIEIRSKFQFEELQEFGFVEKCPFVFSELPLKSLDENWNMLSPNHRRNVRKAGKKGVVVRLASSVTEMKIFNKILANHYKQLGLPFFTESFFIQIWNKLIQSKQACLLLSEYQQEIVGGLLLFFSGKTLIAKYSACIKNKDYERIYASYALFWEGIRLGVNHNFTYFNLGITDKSHRGLLDFKSRFGSQSSPLYFYYYPISGRIPDYSSYLSTYSLPKKVWRVAPRFLASPIGQKINEWIC